MLHFNTLGTRLGCVWVVLRTLYVPDPLHWTGDGVMMILYLINFMESVLTVINTGAIGPPVDLLLPCDTLRFHSCRVWQVTIWLLKPNTRALRIVWHHTIRQSSDGELHLYSRAQLLQVSLQSGASRPGCKMRKLQQLRKWNIAYVIFLCGCNHYNPSLGGLWEWFC